MQKGNVTLFLVIKLYKICLNVLCYVINIQVYWFVIWDKLLLIILVLMKNKNGANVCLQFGRIENLFGAGDSSSWTDGLYI